MKRMRIIHKSGDKYNRWSLISFRKWSGTAQVWLCRCNCGVMKNVRVGDLRTGKNKSCGCLTVETNTTHGESAGKRKTVEYTAWNGMKDRCHNPNNPHYKNYGGRGISVCKRWKESFENFLVDMRRRPRNCTSIDRIDVNKGYCPNNCKWATRIEQVDNRRNTIKVKINGASIPLGAECRRLRINYAMAYSRFLRGWPPEKIFSTPSSHGNRIKRAG